jgi:hypothetical protein
MVGDEGIMQTIEIVEKLSLHEQFRLVEIAHETTNSDIRTAALRVLAKYLNPMVRMVDNDKQQPKI